MLNRNHHSLTLNAIANEGARPVMDYVDLKLAAKVQPDQNGCMWMYFTRAFHGVDEMFDLNERNVRALRDACNEFLQNLEQEKE